jgi:hypothetical protein
MLRGGTTIGENSDKIMMCDFHGCWRSRNSLEQRVDVRILKDKLRKKAGGSRRAGD